MKNKQCKSCQYYHGRSYEGIFLVCGLHPLGKENCPDYQKRNKSSFKQVLITFIKVFTFASVVTLILSIPLVLSLFLFLSIAKYFYTILVNVMPIIADSRPFDSLMFGVLFLIWLAIFYGEFYLFNYLFQKKLGQLSHEIRKDVIKKNCSTDLLEMLDCCKTMGIATGGFFAMFCTRSILLYFN
jgi:hypothetical protein